MRQIFSAIVLGGVRCLALLLLAGVVGCRSDGAVTLPMPSKIIDLSPVITEDLAVRQYGHRATDFHGLKQREAFTPVVPPNQDYTFGLTQFELVSHVGAHLDAPGRLLKGGDRADQVPLKNLFGRARLVDLRWKDRHSPLQITDLENYTISPDEILILF